MTASGHTGSYPSSPVGTSIGGKPATSSTFMATVHALVLVLTWYCLSTAISLYNKHLMGNKYGILDGEPFPLPMLMTAVQFAMQHIFARTAHSLGIPRSIAAGEVRTWATYNRTVLPNGVSTGLDIALSNASFAFITLSFYTMCKSSAPLFLLLFAFLWRIETPTWSLGGTVFIISMGLLMLVAGEDPGEFNLLGFLMVMSAACLSGLRWTITQILLQGSSDTAAAGGHSVSSGTALEVMESLTPIMAATSATVSICFEPWLHALNRSAYFSSFSHVALSAGLMCIGAVIAFFMVWVEFALIGSTSALTFMVAGVFKELVTVVVAHFSLGDSFTPLNGAGLAVLMSGVALFNYQKYRKMQEMAVGSSSRGRRGREGALGDDEAMLLSDLNTDHEGGGYPTYVSAGDVPVQRAGSSEMQAIRSPATWECTGSGSFGDQAEKRGRHNSRAQHSTDSASSPTLSS